MAAGDVTCDITRPLAKHCAVFDGTDDYINCGTITTDRAQTVSVWVKALSFATDFTRLIDARDVGSGWAMWGATNGTIVWRHDGTGGGGFKSATSTTAVDDNTWYNIIGTCDADAVGSGTEMQIFVNGIFEANTAGTATALVSRTGQLRIGLDQAGTNDFAGSIADVRIWNRILTQAEITKVAAGESVTNGLIHRYILKDNANDSVGSNNGTLVGAYLSAVDDQVSAVVAGDRTTANDRYLITTVNNQVITTVVEEAP